MQVGEYQILEELARSAESTVYRAHAPRLGREVALKLAHRASDASRLARQAEALRAVVHRYVVQVHEVGEFQGRAFLVLDLVPGPTLAQRIAERGPLRPGQAAELVRQLAEAVAHAHERGVIHGALRPERVLLSGGEPRLAGFRERGSSESDAPEDVFGLGAILRAALTGKLGETPSGEGLLDDIEPADMGVLTRRCLSADPSQRPTAPELIEALARLLDYSGERTSWNMRPGGSRFVLVLAGGLLGLLLVAAVLITILVRRRATSEVPPPAGGVRAETPKTEVTAAPAPAPTALEQAEAHRKAGRLREATALLDQVIATSPGDAAGHKARGQVHLQGGALEAARVDLRRALSITPKDMEARCLLSDALLRGKRWEDARLQLDAVLRTEPKNARAWRWWGRASFELGHWGDALHGCTLARDLAPGDPWCEAELGRLYGRVGRHDLALQAFDAALKRGEDPALRIASLSGALRAGAIQVAGRDLERLSGATLETPPDLEPALLAGQEAILDASVGWKPAERKTAVAHLRRLVARFPRTWVPSSLLGSLLLFEGRLQGAQSALQLAVDRDPKAAESVGRHAVSLILVRQHEVAREALAAAVQGPNGQRYRLGRVGAAALAGKTVRARELALRALANMPATPSRVLVLAMTHALVGRRAEAVAELRQGKLERLIPSLPQPGEKARVERILELFVAASLSSPYPTARLRETLRRYGRDPWVMLWASDAARVRGQPLPLRTEILSQTRDLLPESHPATVYLAAALVDGGKLKAALDVVTRGLKRFPKSVQLRLLQARTAFELDRPERMVEAYRQGIEAQQHPILANNLASCLIDIPGKRAEAIKLARYAVSKLPRAGTLSETLAWALACDGQLDEALTVMKRALELGANSATTWGHYADILWQLGNQEESRRALRVAELIVPRSGTLGVNLREAEAAIAGARKRITGR